MIQAVLLLLIAVLSVVYLYFKYTFKYWIKKGIPQENPTFIVGNFLDVVLNKKNPGWIYHELYEKYQNHDAVGLYEFQIPRLLVRNPELCETILIKEFSNFCDNEFYVNLKTDPFLKLNAFIAVGEKWKPARNALTNGLTKSKLKDMYEIMKQTVPLLKNYVEDHVDTDIEAMELAGLFMMTNTSNTVFGINSNCFIDPNATVRKMVKALSEGYWQSLWITLLIFNLQCLKNLLGIPFLPKKVSKFVQDMLRQVIDNRLKSNLRRGDFLDHYLNSNKSLEDKITEIICVGHTFFIGGFETSTLPSGNLIYELALNPDIQENLYQELKIAYEGRTELDYDTLMTLPLLDKAFKETLRKYPIMYGMYKRCTKPTTLNIDGKPVKIDKDVLVFIPTFAMQHDPQHYPDPEMFDPERFTEEAIRSRHPCTWSPFGLGPRICAGMNFGILQVKLLIASLVYSYRIERTDRTPQTISLKKTAFPVVPVEAQWIRLVKRI